MNTQQINALRREIREKITALRKKIAVAREAITKLSRCRSEISCKMEAWESEYAAFQSRPITGEIYMEDLFEGNIAQLLSGEVPRTAERMVHTTGMMEELCLHIQNQITRLEEYIEELWKQVEELMAELNALKIM